ncbi:phosphatidate cytidylyltransferase [Roseixanthobacter glucoisosaccharinicivorans]|uniref:phosphatidate cytidylyltransferase n=1 Tax=Roseixanthobacter glucoisosaccharinicivorans TaxID=3119923 RepID=UPI0037289C9F
MIGGKDLPQRTLSAAILAPLVLALTWFGGWPFALIWALAGIAIVYECGTVARVMPRLAPIAIGGAAVLAASAVLAATGSGAGAALICLCGAGLAILVARGRLWAGAGVLCGAVASLPIVALRDTDQLGFVAVLFLYAVVWSTDIGAYFTGRTLGGPKLWPRLSPNKTWSGAVGGAICGMAAGIALLLAAGLVFNPMWAALGIVLSAVAQAGDLAESAFKRAFGVKDTGSLIPGHGGVLDRLDGFLAAVLLAGLIGFARNDLAPAAGLLLW